jgi:FkbM family methyltransferase
MAQETMRLEYGLASDSVVFDLGGYEGQWASDIFSRYCCNVFVFEPVPEFAAALAKRFARNPKVKVHAFGLGGETCSCEIAVDGASSSLCRGGERRMAIEIRRAKEFLEEQRISRIDLMKINIEGAEYDLLEHLFAIGFVKNIHDVQVQFHDCVPRAHERRNALRCAFSETHILTYDYPFLWENWRHNPNSRC